MLLAGLNLDAEKTKTVYTNAATHSYNTWEYNTVPFVINRLLTAI